LTDQIEKKTARVGNLGVEIVTMKQDLSESEAAMIDDQKFLNDLSGNCEGKKAEWDERTRVRGEELVAIHETIKILNDDDALDLFKSALPGAASSFVQMKTRKAEMRSLALAAIRDARNRLGQPSCQKIRGGCHQLDFIMLALHGQRLDSKKLSR